MVRMKNEWYGVGIPFLAPINDAETVGIMEIINICTFDKHLNTSSSVNILN